MPRKPLIITTTFPYHVTNRSNNREWFYIPIEDAWQIFLEVLSLCEDRYRSEIHTFVLMSNHYHLLVTTPRGNLSFLIRYLHTEVSRRIQKQTGRINHIFGGRYKWSALQNSSAIAYAYKYVARNPVAAEICTKVESYRFSTLYSEPPESYPFGLSEGFSQAWGYIPRLPHERLAWLNQPTPKELEMLVSKALRRYDFAFSQGNDSRKRLRQLSHFYQIPLHDTFSAEK